MTDPFAPPPHGQSAPTEAPGAMPQYGPQYGAAPSQQTGYPPAGYGQSNPAYGQPAAYGQSGPAYGQPYGQPGFGQWGGQPPGTNGLAIASLVLGILGIFTLGFAGIVGLILGIIARKQVKRTGQNGGGLALAGIILGAIGVLFAIGFIVLIAVGVSNGHACTYYGTGSNPCTST